VKAELLRYGYPKADRLRKRPEYLKLADEGQRLFSRHFILVYAARQNPPSRLGITVTKKVGPAVIRNRLKRVCREFFRTHRDQLAGAFDLHFIARRAAALAGHEELKQSLEKLFSQIG
jgi:ribonuclease P protein component